MRFSCVNIITKFNSQEAANVAQGLGEFLRSRGIEVLHTGALPKTVIGAKSSSPNEIKADLIVVVGGDGTIMRTAQVVGETPILGVKVGALGFLCETTPELAKDALEKVLAGKYYLEYKTKLTPRFEGLKLPDALNEVLITTSKPSKILSLMVKKDGVLLHHGKADGVIVSTPTGSTAYALSAGGPIIDPKLDVLEVVFICPLSAGIRPMIFPVSSSLEITVLPEGFEGIAVLDGQTTAELEYDKPVTIKKSEKKAVFIRVNNSEFFYQRIREKITCGFEA